MRVRYNFFALLAVLFVINSSFFAQNEPQLILQKEVTIPNWDILAVQSMTAGANSNEFYLVFNGAKYEQEDTIKVVLAKYSGQDLEIQWSATHPKIYSNNALLIWEDLFYVESENSLRWITDLPTSEQSTLLNVDAISGESEFLANLGHFPEAGLWEDKIVSTKEYENNLIDINVYNKNGELLSWFEYIKSDRLVSRGIGVYSDAAYFLCSNLDARYDTTLPKNLFVKFDLEENNIAWEIEIETNNHWNWAKLDFDNEGNIYVVRNELNIEYPILSKYNSAGELLWEESIDSELYAWGILVVSDLNIVITTHNGFGTANSYYYGFNAETGEKLFGQSFRFGHENAVSSLITDADKTSDNQLALAGLAIDTTGGTSIGKNYLAVFDLSEITSVDEDRNNMPVSFSLSPNYPNPFNPSTTISYSIPKQSNVSLKVYDMLGREVTELVNGEKAAGSYEANFDASSLSSGVYFYTLNASNFSQTRKMLLVK